MNKLTKQICEVALVLSAAVVPLGSARAQDQHRKLEDLNTCVRRLSEAIFASIMPTGTGYVITTSSKSITVRYAYRGDVTTLREAHPWGRIWPVGAGSVRITRTAATREGAILAGGNASCRMGPARVTSSNGLAGTTAQSLLTVLSSLGKSARRPTARFGASEGTWSPMTASNTIPMFFALQFRKGSACTVFCGKHVAAPVTSESCGCVIRQLCSMRENKVSCT